MATVVYLIDAPPTGIEKTGEGFDPTDEQMAEERQARQAFLDAVTPHLAALASRPARRSGNVDNVELLGGDTWSNLNHYLLLVTTDIGEPGIAFDSFLPPGTKVTEIGNGYSALWSNGG
ncbi:hypothetical protein [Streptomyces sp. NRRL B-3648]|uniref:hypothetical protein n=1 Tax=Streptomyces sp. NRRL B-3648 TaxID=1519493 RepID=UPI0006B029C7|nr:hypothetical protein [Streptomyces sp. NRRL B-3648]KOV97306.1 hypothetical protein ADL04_15840 [Streptomyces sp. NRRL B-3648]